MNKPLRRRPPDEWDGQTIPPGEHRHIKLMVSESYSGVTINIPLYVRRGREPGPAVFVTAALHGNEINGTGAVRAIIRDPGFQIKAGTLILLPVVNILGFDRHTRYLPDGRDLNRCFPGSPNGSQASRLAHVIFSEIVSRCDFGIDLHTAAMRRTNFPNVRGDMSIPGVQLLAEAFGTEYIVDGGGPTGTLRRAACGAGCPTIILEGGEIWKVEPIIVESTVRGIRNVLIKLGMLEGQPVRAPKQTIIQKTKWIRADRGGFLQFHVRPGEVVREGQPLATNTSLLGQEQNVLVAPYRGLVIGMTTLPAVSPGEPVCHLGKLPPIDAAAPHAGDWLADDLRDRTIGDLATNVLVVDPDRE
ncbi:MAG: succinylglutamate desuccinylase/aspartoacylase family protein [Planctomycetaceae bacterium]|nr:succinylglutamate desuccinylase/aspartoacylase family protein [Planctomycetaceae bacterium]